MNAKNNGDDIAFKLLEALDTEPVISQRVLADRMGIALGLVNAYIKRLCGKGYLKVKFLPRNRVRYIITPQGLAEKSRLAYKYMHYSIIYFKDVRRRIEAVYHDMIAAGVRRVLLWGDGELAELCYISTRGYDLDIVGVVGRARAEKAFFGTDVYPADDFSVAAFDAVLVSTLNQRAMQQLSAAGIAPEKIYFLEQGANNGAVAVHE